MMAYLQLKHQGDHLHGLDKRDTYTNSIINDNDGNFKAQNVTYQMTHMQLKQYKIYFMVWTSEISNDDGN